jgi:molecular chaperone DnaK
LRKLLDGNDIEAIKTATEALMAASQTFSQKLYEAAARDGNAAGTSASGQSGPGNADDEIIDAEIVDDQK